MSVSSPSDIVEEFCAALDGRDWLAVTALSDPQSLERVRDERIRYARDVVRPEGHAQRSWDRMLGQMPSAAQAGLTDASRPSLARDFHGVVTLQQLENMTTPDLVAAALSSAIRIPEHWRPERKWLGTVFENDTVAHLLYRIRFGTSEQAWGDVELISLRRTGDRWRVLWNGRAQFGLPGLGGFHAGPQA